MSDKNTCSQCQHPIGPPTDVVDIKTVEREGREYVTVWEEKFECENCGAKGRARFETNKHPPTEKYFGKLFQNK